MFVNAICQCRASHEACANLINKYFYSINRFRENCAVWFLAPIVWLSCAGYAYWIALIKRQHTR